MRHLFVFAFASMAYGASVVRFAVGEDVVEFVGECAELGDDEAASEGRVVQNQVLLDAPAATTATTGQNRNNGSRPSQGPP